MNSYWLNNRLRLSYLLLFFIIGSNVGSCASELVWLYSIDGYGNHDYFQNPQGLWFDSVHNELLIADSDNNTIGIFDTQGNLKYRFGTMKKVSSPISIASDSAGNILWSEVNTRKIKQTDFRGEALRELNFAPSQSDIIPGKVYLDQNNLLYFIDRANGTVLKSNRQGELQNIITSTPENPMYGDQMTDLEIDKEGKLYLLTSLGPAVHIFNNQYQLLQNFGQHGEEEFNVSFPTGLAIDPANRIWIVDSFQHRLKVFSSTGKYLFQLGTTGQQNGQFYFPIDLVFDTKGRIYVLEKGTNRVQVFELKE
jgi:DNA-binding beta-propeller fold protein YncE